MHHLHHSLFYTMINIVKHPLCVKIENADQSMRTIIENCPQCNLLAHNITPQQSTSHHNTFQDLEGNPEWLDSTKSLDEEKKEARENLKKREKSNKQKKLASYMEEYLIICLTFLLVEKMNN